ncbi:MAG: porin family protein [Marinoscillum sp.]|uniref:porin family protein n=1 Tax=Marinoscillum sp. TaxID=2024838 RepID=UPI0032FE1EAB
MHSRLVGFALVLLLSLQIVAQESYFGWKVGYNMTTLKGENSGSLSLSPRNTFGSSFVLSTQLKSLPIGFSMEPGYILKGTQIDHDTLDYKFHYLNMPLLLDVYPVKRLKLSLGVEIARLLSAKNHANDSTRQNLLSTYDKRWEASVTAGASLSVSYFMDLGMRYSTALTQVSNQDAIIDRKNLFNQYIQLSLLFKIAN